MPEETISNKWWYPLLELLIHIVVGTGFFVLIAMPAIGLDALVTWLERGVSNKIVIYGLRFAEYFLFLIDIILFVCFLIRTAWRTGRKL